MTTSRRDLLATALAFAALPACSIASRRGPIERLDRRTGLTLRITRDPFLFLRDDPSVAARSHDVVAIHALELNRSGNSDFSLALFTWSTIDRLGRAPPPAPDRWILILDDRRIVLSPGEEPRAAGVSEWPGPWPARGAALRIHPVDLASLRYWADASRQWLQGEAASVPQEPYWPGSDGRAALRDWLAGT